MVAVPKRRFTTHPSKVQEFNQKKKRFETKFVCFMCKSKVVHIPSFFFFQNVQDLLKG